MTATRYRMPITEVASLHHHLAHGWACFQHGSRFWLSRRVSGVRVMVPVPPWLIERSINEGAAEQCGILVTPVFTMVPRRTA